MATSRMALSPEETFMAPSGFRNFGTSQDAAGGADAGGAAVFRNTTLGFHGKS